MNLKKRWPIIFFLQFSILIFSANALATLGEKVIVGEGQKITKFQRYSTSETMLTASPALQKLKEFSDSENNVFAVCWKGQRPGLYRSTFLNQHYAELYKKALKSAVRHKGQRFLVAKLENFVLKTSGQGRTFMGCAYDPALVPSGVDSNEIK